MALFLEKKKIGVKKVNAYGLCWEFLSGRNVKNFEIENFCHDTQLTINSGERKFSKNRIEDMLS